MKESTQTFWNTTSTPIQRDRVARLIKSADRIEKHPHDGLAHKHVLVFDEDTDEEERVTVLSHTYNEITDMLYTAWARQYEEAQS